MLRFNDGTQAAVNGLEEILAHLHAQGKPANQETAEEIIALLETEKNYIPSSEATRREYAFLLLKEYREFMEGHPSKTG